MSPAEQHLAHAADLDGASLEPLIVCRGVSKTYRMGETDVQALCDVDVEIAAGEFVAVTGASGSGKSTFMNLLGALDVPTSGSLVVDGRDLGHLSSDELAAYRNEVVGFVFQSFHLLPRTSALENVALPLLYSHLSRREGLARAHLCLELVGLGERWKHHPSQLSGGQQQRVAIARALVNAPRLLLADEPTGALDTHTTDEILGIFEQLNETGITVVLVTHEHDVADRARRRLTFRDGRVVEDVR